MEILKTILKENYLVFDVGSNIGNKAETYLAHNTKVVGFEPQPNCINKLNNRFKHNTKYILEPIGLAETKGVTTIYESNAHTISSMSKEFIDTVSKERFKGYSWPRKIEVNVDTLDSMITKYGQPNYIKIDVEGYEFNVLKGLTTPVDLISIEFTPELSSTSVDCINYMESINGECIYNYGYREDTFFKFDNWLNKKEMLNYITSVKDYRVEFGDIYIKKV